MGAPDKIQSCINDIQTRANSRGGFPLHFDSMGGRGGAGCDVLSVNSKTGEIEIQYQQNSFIINQDIYAVFEKRFNLLDKQGSTLKDGRPEKYGVNRYQKDLWQNTPLGLHRNPLPATIFKGLGY